MQADEPGAFWIPNINAFADRQGYKPKYIILHGTAGGSSAEDTAAFFQSTQGSSNPVSSHYIIGRDGHVVQCIRESDGAWANGAFSAGHDSFWDERINPNNITISIEHCKPHDDNSDQLTDVQKQASFVLVQHICQRYDIPMQWADANGGITGHYSIDPVNRARCPGPYPFDELFAYLKGNTMSGVPQGWTYDPQKKILTAPGGVQVREGFAEWILTHNWDPANIPLQPEQGLNPLELAHPELGGGTQQLFRGTAGNPTALEWTAHMGVFEAWMGPEIIALRNLIMQANQQVTSLQAKVKQLTDQLAQPAQDAAEVKQLQAVVSDYENRLNTIAQTARIKTS